MNNLSEAILSQPLPEKPLVSNASSAFDRFKSLGLPDGKHEEYKYAPLRKLFHENLVESFDEHIIPSALLNGYYLVFHNGEFDKTKSLIPSGVRIEPYNETYNKEFDALISGHYSNDGMYFAARAGAKQGYTLMVSNSVHVNKPVYILSFYDGSRQPDSTLSVLRRFIWESGAVCVFQEWQVAKNAGLITIQTTCEIEDHAQARHELFQDLRESARVFNYSFILQKSLITSQFNVVCTGNGYSRNNMYLNLGIKGAEAHLHGLSIVGGNGWTDHHTTVDHCLPNGQSRQLYKSIVSDRGNYVFNGKIFVRRDAQKTNAYQSSKNLLVSGDAQANAKPQLEIFADDVRCSHGSSTGHISEDALFYLRARGIGEGSAKKVLLQAYASEITNMLYEGIFKELVTELTEKAISVN